MARASVLLRVEEVRKAAAGSLHKAEPCVIVIFGASGDLTRRKLMPSLFHLMQDGLLDDDFAILGVDREGDTDESFRAAIRAALEEFRRGDKPIDEETWTRFSAGLFHVRGELNDAATYRQIGERLKEIDDRVPNEAGHLFYLAIPPSLYASVIEHLAESGVAPPHPPPAAPPRGRGLKH
jgi:glucose-6-phosphate 1-dehydrogenase